MHPIVAQIQDLFERHGGDAYFGEPVTQAAHGLQAAHLARESGAPDSLIVAALLHDIGHLIHGDESLADAGIDGRHEDLGADWLEAHFGPEVCDPVRLHVPAKRYLCATDPAYVSGLSPASITSLGLQGGPFTDAEVAAFDALPHAVAALQLRRWDDGAKVVDWDVPGLESYLPLIKRAVRR